MTPTQRDHLAVLGSPSQKETASGRTLGQLSGFLRLFPFSQNQSHAAYCPVCKNCHFIYSIQFSSCLKQKGKSGSCYFITARSRTILGHLKASVQWYSPRFFRVLLICSYEWVFTGVLLRIFVFLLD